MFSHAFLARLVANPMLMSCQWLILLALSADISGRLLTNDASALQSVVLVLLVSLDGSDSNQLHAGGDAVGIMFLPKQLCIRTTLASSCLGLRCIQRVFNELLNEQPKKCLSSQ